ncbi:E3 ubiquitin-protein ligase XBAT33 [Morella rubra]|uniref:RING-type E3 ubiquitin transferase n=1 Tax=Morella rubra TaxID=262757 RepID=A0A6A1VI50_9ROSI|nr:E3 ubiquitin-protein ligase XBAT33 [Morella rubra]
MGNSFGCSASGERLVSAARDGDLIEAKMLLDCNPCLAKYSTFGGLNSPLHFAAAKGHNEIVALLLENGADVNSRNYCGQTALMQACRYGHWEVVQTLLLFRCNVIRADYLSGRTALHFAAINGHPRCIRLVMADFVPSAPFEAMHTQTNGDRGDAPDVKNKYDQSVLSKFVNKAADGGITALHMAALNGYFECVQLLLDLHSNVSAVTFHYGTSMDLIGMILIARGASRITLNCNGWLPVDVARMWGRHWLEPLLAPNSNSIIPTFPPSNYLSVPLLSVLNIGRDHGSLAFDDQLHRGPLVLAEFHLRTFVGTDYEVLIFKVEAFGTELVVQLVVGQVLLDSSTTSSDDTDVCAVCLERACSVAAEGKVLCSMSRIKLVLRRIGMWIHVAASISFNAVNVTYTFENMDKWGIEDGCGHELCIKCALYLCSTCNIPSELVGPPGSIPCPLCRYGIISFVKMPGSPAKENKLHISLGLCTPCMLHPRDLDRQSPARTPEIRKNRVASVSSDIFCPVTCSPFPSVAIPLCTCNDGPCPSFETREVESQDESPRRSQAPSMDHDKMEGPRLERPSCSSMFWGRRSCSREHQCNSEINA